MPYRTIPFVTGEIYHVFNRSIARQPVFLNQRDYQRAYQLIDYYRFFKLNLRFSHYNRLPLELRIEYLNRLYSSQPKIIEILAFCLMPNHFHFQIKQLIDGGISMFISNWQNSYAKYKNTKTNRTGSLFQAMFKSARMETDEQLIHVNRYIHLNPLTSYVLNNKRLLASYPWCSFIDYLGKRSTTFISTGIIDNYFSSPKKYVTFTLDRLDYQRELESIKHLVHE